MQGFEQTGQQPADAGALAGHLIPEGSMFAFLAAHRAELFPDAEYAGLFAPPGVGRPSLPAARMAAIMTLQAMRADHADAIPPGQAQQPSIRPLQAGNSISIPAP